MEKFWIIFLAARFSVVLIGMGLRYYYLEVIKLESSEFKPGAPVNINFHDRMMFLWVFILEGIVHIYIFRKHTIQDSF